MPMSSSSSWTSGPRSVRSTSTASGGGSHRPPFRRPFQQQQRQTNVTEVDEEDEWVGGEEGDGDEGGGEAHQAYTLEEVLQAEAEDLANELDQAEKEGLDAELLTDLESGVEQAAGSLITMRRGSWEVG